ncbi:peptide/nickel transport system permease protein [Variovorax ginsengisoli]|uniref:Peptide/nickel transport system permease protein n=2 Tax=Variovorax ginsengisoli TaxID=363844 RepID=A0ABT9SCC7_9BURK|nr:peptide/nickel transport system permease protein [Variovorax ginsengisoli]
MRMKLHFQKRAWAGAVVLALVLVCALFAPWLAPHDPLEQDLMAASLPPAWSAGGEASHPFGTDTLGRDILSRLVHGARPAMIVAVVGATLAALIGTVLGLWAGFHGGAVDTVVSRLVDVWMSFPAVLLSIVLVAVIGTGLGSVVLAIAIIDWTRFCRVVRAETQVQASLDYVTSARTIGQSRSATLWREVLPNVAPLLLTLFTLEMGIAVVIEAILSFVGLSVSSDMPTWGGLVQEGRLYVNQTPWLLGLPIAAIAATVLACNALGDGLRASLDPLLER